MTISVLGVIMVVVTIIILGYLGIQAISSTLSSDVGSGSSYDQLAVLKTDYSTLDSQYNSVKTLVDKRNNQNVSKAYASAELELIKAQSAISDVESAISAGKPTDEVKTRIEIARKQLETAQTALNSLKSKL
jgi:hypothetical protein